MNREYIPKPGEHKMEEHYPSGPVSIEYYLKDGGPANGWSWKTYYEAGRLKQERCFSHGTVIEQIDYDLTGNTVSHKIYSHREKALIEKPIQREVVRPNVVSGCAHMGIYYRDLPKIAAFIEAEYDENSLEAAYQDFLKDVHEQEEAEDNAEEPEYTWFLKGKEMSFAIQFERHEMLYFWHLFARTEENYAKARLFMEELRM